MKIAIEHHQAGQTLRFIQGWAEANGMEIEKVESGCQYLPQKQIAGVQIGMINADIVPMGQCFAQ